MIIKDKKSYSIGSKTLIYLHLLPQNTDHSYMPIVSGIKKKTRFVFSLYLLKKGNCKPPNPFFPLAPFLAIKILVVSHQTSNQRRKFQYGHLQVVKEEQKKDV